jgi:hypothetical protein
LTVDIQALLVQDTVKQEITGNLQTKVAQHALKVSTAGLLSMQPEDRDHAIALVNGFVKEVRLVLGLTLKICKPYYHQVQNSKLITDQAIQATSLIQLIGIKQNVPEEPIDQDITVLNVMIVLQENTVPLKVWHLLMLSLVVEATSAQVNLSNQHLKIILVATVAQ